MQFVTRVPLAASFVLVGLLCLGVRPAAAGVTIHYEGHAKNSAAVDGALAMARVQAKLNGWTIVDASLPSTSLTRVIADEKKPYVGPLKGVVIYAHEQCEPIHLQFGRDLFLQDFVKTQFAGAEVHVKIVGLFRKLQRYFADLKIDDEGEYWTSRDQVKLAAHLEDTRKAMEKILRSRPTARGPLRTNEGRMIDLIQ
jgi:hypothetical protein